MPYYEMKCQTCAEISEIRATVAEKTAGAMCCPACGSADLATIYKPVQTLKFKDRNCDVCPGGARPMGGCGGGTCAFSG